MSTRRCLTFKYTWYFKLRSVVLRGISTCHAVSLFHYFGRNERNSTSPNHQLLLRTSHHTLELKLWVDGLCDVRGMICADRARRRTITAVRCDQIDVTTVMYKEAVHAWQNSSSYHNGCTAHGARWCVLLQGHTTLQQCFHNFFRLISHWGRGTPFLWSSALMAYYLPSSLGDMLVS